MIFPELKTESEVYVAIDEDMRVKTFESIAEIFLYYIEVKSKYLKKRKAKKEASK